MKKIKAQIILDESKYGKGLFGVWRWAFESPHYQKKSIDADKEDGSLITVTDNEKPILIAVTKKQFKSWNKQKIFAVRRPLLEYYMIRINNIYKNIKSILKRHIIKSSTGYYGYFYYFNFTLIISKYGLKIITSRYNQSIWNIIYEYYWHSKKRLISNYGTQGPKGKN